MPMKCQAPSSLYDYDSFYFSVPTPSFLSFLLPSMHSCQGPKDQKSHMARHDLLTNANRSTVYSIAARTHSHLWPLRAADGSLYINCNTVIQDYPKNTSNFELPWQLTLLPDASLPLPSSATWNRRFSSRMTEPAGGSAQAFSTSGPTQSFRNWTSL